MKKIHSFLWLASAVLLSIVGFLAFFWLFLPQFNVYWMILSPIIIALYQFPAVYVYWLWKKRRNR